MSTPSANGSRLQPVTDSLAIGWQVPGLAVGVFQQSFGSAHKRFDPSRDIPDLTGKVIVVTGGNTGLGQETVLRLAQHKPKQIYLAVRTASKADSAIDQIRKTVPDAAISHIPLDLTSFESIRQCADTIKAQSDRLDILINNAGIMAAPMNLTKEGYEITMGTNHLGHFLLVQLLLPLLAKTAAQPASDVRIVNISSDMRVTAPYPIPLETLELEKHSTWRRYASSKEANILHAKELARRYPQITSISIHPGVIFTGLYETLRGYPIIGSTFKFFEKTIATVIFPSIPQGAMSQLWAATAPKDIVQNGVYYLPVGWLKEAPQVKASDAQRLWEWSAAQIEKHGY